MNEFKIGDWAMDISPESGGVFLVDTQEKLEQAVNGSSYIKWAPKEDEWCWFTSVNGNSELGQFVTEYSQGRYRYRLNGTNSLFNADASRCEPFIGQLPNSTEATK